MYASSRHSGLTLRTPLGLYTRTGKQFLSSRRKQSAGRPGQHAGAHVPCAFVSAVVGGRHATPLPLPPLSFTFTFCNFTLFYFLIKSNKIVGKKDSLGIPKIVNSKPPISTFQPKLTPLFGIKKLLSNKETSPNSTYFLGVCHPIPK